jgi:hypothetical protein
MFRKKRSLLTKLMTGFTATSIGLTGVAGENDLYSDVQTGSVFTAGDSGADKDSPDSPRVHRRITSLEQIVQLLRDASLESRKAEGRSVTTLKTLEPWLFPVTITLSDDEQTLQICVVLGAVADQQKADAGKLLSLLEANKLQTSAKFGFNRVRSRTELLGQLRNDGVTAELLRDEINRLTSIAKESELLWQIEPARTQSKTDSSTTVPDAAVRLEETSPAAGKPAETVNSGETTVPVTNPASPVATPAAPSAVNGTDVPSSSFTGRWSASRASNEAFAILFDANGSFVLVSIKDGKQAKSAGKFIVNGAQLTLEGTDGVRLNGTFQMKSSTEFSFQPTPANGTVAAFNFRKSP